MIDKPENPAAFPCTGEGHGNPKYWTPGMTLRDYFAAQVAAGACMEMARAGQSIRDLAPAIAKSAFQVADAMLAERLK